MDQDKDGTPDLERWSVSDRGSGFHGGCSCTQSPPGSGEVGCAETQGSAYTSFWGWRATGGTDSGEVPAGPAAPNCVPLDRSRSDQASLWLLHGLQRGGDLTRKEPLRWHTGAPKKPVAVCMRPKEAEAFAGGLAWGQFEEDSHWVVYTPPRNASMQLGSPELFEALARSEDGQRVVMLNGHSLVLYDKVQNRHAWLVNLEAGLTGDFKADRWRSVKSVKLSADSVEIRYRMGASGEQEGTVRVGLE